MKRRYAILKKIATPLHNQRYSVLSSLPDCLDSMGHQPVAFDLETHGTDPIRGTVRSIAIANDYGAYAIDYEALSKPEKLKLTKWLSRQRLIAHNAVFDVAWIYAKTGCMPQIETCTMVLFKLLSTEGFLGQRWGLKYAMTHILGWPETNEKDLDDWLLKNKLKKKDMAQAPWDILGKYNALDAVASWQLYKYFLKTMEYHEFTEAVQDFQKDEFINLVKLLIEQQVNGMHIDIPALMEYDDELTEEIEEKRQEFIHCDEVESHIDYYQQCIIEDFKKKEPPKLKKDGGITVRWTKWEAKLEALKKRYDFNLNSNDQLQWLFYESMGLDCPVKTEKSPLPSVSKKAIPYLGPAGVLLQQYRTLRDIKKFVTALKNVHVDGIFHPTIKPHGTLTGRGAGGLEDK